MLDEAPFHNPVVIRSGDTITVVRTAREAADTLSTAWPEARGKWYHAARRACASAVEGRTSPHIARRIFAQAAQESHLGT